MKERFEGTLTRRLLSLALSMAMVLTLLPMPSIAAEGDGLCEHHPKHTADCGYVAAVEGKECGHVCGDECYTVTPDCKHIHDAGCYSDGALPAETPKEADACTHECTEESGCVTKTHTCVHTDHDDSCGYVEAVAGQPCCFVCEACAGKEPEELLTTGDTVLTDWEWVDDWEIIDPDSGDVLLPFASAENVAQFDDITQMLPAAIAADGEELTLGDWTCEAYPVETGAYEGEYVFETTLPEGYVLEDGTNVLSLTVVLGDPEGEPVGLLAITPSEPTQVDGVYQLSTKEHLYWFAEQVNSGNNAINAVLTQDITVNSGVLNTDGTLKTGSFEEWTPIGTADHPYVGSFDGKNHTIYGLYVNTPNKDNIGLFGYIGYYSTLEKPSSWNVTVQNVTIRDSYFAGKDYVGAVCGNACVNWGLVLNLNQCVNYGTVAGNEYVGGICGYNGGNTTNCKNYGKVSGSTNIGGVCGGSSSNSKSTGCYNEGTVTGSSDGAGGVGGICGNNRGSIENSRNIGAVRGKDKVGGVCGSSGGSNFTTSITGCDNNGTVTASDSFVGGICGYSYSQITNCHNTAAVQGGSTVGGVCGTNNQGTIKNCDNTAPVTGNSSNNVGGVCGYNLSGTITSCYNTASVTGNRNASVCAVGGVCGDNSSGTITSCYNTGAVQGYYQVGGVCGESQSSGAITLCYNTGALQGDDQVGGVCGYNYDSSISNCYNSSTIECSGSYLGGICGKKLGTGTLTNVYFDHKSDTIKKAFYGQAVCSEGRTTEQFASGEVAYLLNGSSSSGTWRQNLDTGTRDETPNFTSAVVYEATSGACLPGYTNNASRAKNHVLEDHKCVFCDYRDQDPITISGIESITANPKTYDGTTKADLNYNNLVLKNAITDTEVTGVSLTVSGTFDTPGAGQNKTVTIRLELTGTDKYYLVDECQTTTTKANISRREVTVTITPPSGTYGDTILPATARLNNVVSGDNVPVTLKYVGSAYDGESYSDTKVPQKAGAYEVVATILESNYTLIGTHRENFVIGRATVTTPTLTGVTYDGKEHSPSIPADALYHLSDDFSQKNAGTYSLTLTLKDTNNYRWDNQNGETSFTIAQKPLTVTAENKTVTYGDPVPEYTARYDGFVTGETAESLNCVPTFTCNYSVGTSVNQSGYPISVSGLVLDNYEISYTPGTLTVNPKTLDDSNITLTVADENLVYTGSALTPDVSVAWGDKTLTTDTDYTVDYSNNVNAGSAPQVTITGIGNYTGTKSENFVIQPRDIRGVAITVTGDGTLVYTGSEIKPAVTVTNGDYAIAATDYDVSYENNVAAGENTAKVKLTGKNNYTGTDFKTFSINKAGSAVGTVPAAVSGLVYSGQAQTLVTAGSTSHGTLVYSLTQDGTYEAALPTGTNAGSYTVWYKIIGDNNHKDSSPASVSCSIAQKSLTVTAKEHTITYGEAPGNNGVTYDGFVNGETETVLGGQLAYDYSYSQYGDVGTGEFKITPSGLTSNNYAISFVAGKLTVERKEIGISWSNTSLPYTGTAQAPTATATGLVNNDECAITVTGQQTDVGENYTATATTLSSGNYKLPQNVTCTFSITKVAPELTAPTGRTVVYTSTPLELTEGAETSHGTMQYRLGEEGEWSTAVPAATECGTYTVYYKVVGDNNHTDTEPASVTAKILPFAINQEPQDTTIDYGENTALTFKATTKLEGEVTYQWYLVTDSEDGYVELTGETENTLTLTKPNAGEYTYVCIVSCGDYSETSAEADVTVNAVSENLPDDLPGDLWVEGGEEPLVGGSIDLKSPSSFLLTSYTYNGTSDDVHQNYPTGMQVYSVGTDEQGRKTVTPVADLGNLLQYSGCSIRITGKPGIRMITSLTKEAKEALKKGELAGYTLEEYGTVVAWSKELGSQPLTLSTGKSNYAYRKGVSDPVFANVGNLTQYTNVLVWESLTDTQLGQDIVMRPYIKLSKDGETVTLYGGTVERSIYYVAQQNANTFPKGSAGYNYVHEIIGKVDKLTEQSQPS